MKELPSSVLVLLAALLAAPPAAAAPHGPHAPPETPSLQEPPPAEAGEEPAGEDAEGDQDEKKDGWDVSEPPAGFEDLYDVPLDVTEGTWMSLDVTPDGREIVFDLLGDLYSIPIGGGEATSLTSGLAWDMQPRVSPDGRWIAFTSDRGGGDNLWLMRRDGSEPRQVTKESFRLLNSPAWTPDGRFLAARKHFTSFRSLGAGEIWLYHVTGGSGLQMTERPNDQKDLGEPVFSPDGRYLYFSQDVTPGDVFEYNKDSNDEIYVIKRLDRETGEVERFVEGPGGAVRPTPSPDGRLLAFVRRVRGASVLYLRDLASGEEWPVYDRLDRDMQETWAIHGVYPTLAWTPDSASLVFWAGGKIHRLGIDTGEVAEIPFRVRDSRRAAPAVRFPVEVHPETFETRMLRWVTVSPTGDRVVFEALGRLWVRELPGGEPRPLTGQDDHRELDPSFSRDGRFIVYTTWDDAELGAVRLAPASGGAGRQLTTEPGHYVEPAFSPDGRWVVFRKVEGGFLRTPAWSSEPGIYRVSADGGGARRVSSSGIAPHFGDDPSRLYLLTFEAEGRRALVSVDLAGTPEQTPRRHLTSERATELRVSPNGRWVAMREGYNAHVAPFVATGKAVSLGPKATALPVKKVSTDAGEYLHWSGDGRRLHWSLGPKLFTLEVADVFESLDAVEAEEIEEEEEGIEREAGEDETPATSVDLGFEVPSDRPEGLFALVGGRVVTMRGDEVIEDGTVLIENHRIRAVGSRDVVEVPAGAHVVDAAGKTVLPGLVDVHWHGRQGDSGIVPEQNWENLSTLAFGVTTIHDPSNDTATIFAAAEQARAGLILAPRIFSTGTILYGAKAPFFVEIESLDDARSHIKRLQAVGAVTVKSYNQPRRDQRQQVLAAARELGMMVVPEGGSLFQHNMSMIVDGHTGIEHSLPVGAIYDDVRQMWSATEVGYTPTLVVSYGGLSGENYWYAETPVWENERLLAFVPRWWVDPRARRREIAPDDEWGHFANARIAAELGDEEVTVTVGAHGQREGLGAHWELWMLEQGGMTPHEALRAATLDGARYLGMDGDIGSIEAGKLADVIVVDGNPLEDVRSSERVERVILNGRLYDAATLDQLYPEAKKREPLYWQRPPGFFSDLGR